jgi:hypothetical protein
MTQTLFSSTQRLRKKIVDLEGWGGVNEARAII